MLELGEEHRRHAVERRALLAIDDLEHAGGVEELERAQARAVRVGGEHAEHAAEAVKQRHAQAQPIRRRVAKAFADPVAVVDDVPAREHDALGKARRAGRVLHVDHVVHADRGLASSSAASGTRSASARSCAYGCRIRRARIADEEHALHVRGLRFAELRHVVDALEAGDRERASRTRSGGAGIRSRARAARC